MEATIVVQILLTLSVRCEPSLDSCHLAREVNSGRLRILLVDGDKVSRATTAELLSSLGHAVAHAPSSEQALAALDVGGIDMLLVDAGLTHVGECAH